MGRIHGRSEESIHAAYEESRLKKRGEETPPSWVRRVFNFVEFDAPADDVVRRLLVFGSIGYWGTATSRVGAMLFYGLLACIIFLYTKMRDYQKPVAIGFATLIIGLNLGFPEGIMAVQATLVAFFLSCTFLKLPV